MSFELLGREISEIRGESTLKLNGREINKLELNGRLVWEQYTPAGNVTVHFDRVSGNNPDTVAGENGSFVFTPPLGVTEITVCRIAGGGSGARMGLIPTLAGGGRAGDYEESEITITGNQTITIGVGGKRPDQGPIGPTDGNSGSPTTFGSVTVLGGKGGNTPQISADVDYRGVGNMRTTCAGTDRDGNLTGTGTLGFGGQSSGFASGGNGADFDDAEDGRDGSGGGGALNLAGSGGDGLVIISWERQ